ncbi:GNAT family N-acetyltransferase [Parvibaculum sp.]|uniref:GNAT family N-acetyltransferase n=1 Tax=Parvibaculum sp. TaxID=2024848 RepID=UPI002C6DB695|nr:GNAT family N-acetyltransferase [Parvibaculum sp.]HUD52461.1 GNAT family N-acetyltransferase [Parvibaculum sp.]
MTIRQASAGDIPALARVWHDGWHQSHAALDPDIADGRPFRFFTERIASPPVDTIVACVAGEVVGFAHWEGDGIAQVFVLPAWHGHGVAPLLLAAGEAALREKGYRCIWLQCRTGNDRARAFYEKHGWAVTAEVESTLGHMTGRSPVVVWRMEKSLD